MWVLRPISLVVLLECLLGFSYFAAAQGGTVVNATYGAGNRRANVTQRVQSLMQNGTLNFRVTNDTMGMDPAPGQVKELRVQVRQWNGQTRSYTFAENTQASIQLGGNGGGGGNPYMGRLNSSDQQRFDSYYTRWLQYRAQNNRGEIASMEGRMRDVYSKNGIPMSVPFDQVASRSVVQPVAQITPIPGATWQGDPVGTCINAVRARIQQDYGNRVGVNLPTGAARVGSVTAGQLMVPVSGTGQISVSGQPAINTRYDCQIDKRFGNVSNVNYTRPNMTPQPR
jgi:hypothetical protein